MANLDTNPPNTRPINLINKQQSFVNNRGRVYQCLKCSSGPAYQGERSKVMLHIFRKHVALDNVPFYCSICKFITNSQVELEKHIQPNIYPSHKATVDAMLNNGEAVNEAESLLQNLTHYIPTEHDMKRLTKEESEKIFHSRRKVDILKESMIINGLDTESVKSDKTENILPQMLNGHELTPFSNSIRNENPIRERRHSTMKSKNLAPVKSARNKSRSPSPSKSSSSSSSSESISNSELKNEISQLRTEIKTMGQALGNLIHELKTLREQHTKTQQEIRENRNQNVRHEQKENRYLDSRPPHREHHYQKPYDRRPYRY